MEIKTLISFDGTRIVYQVGGTGDRWLVVANGYGGTFCAWHEIFEQLKDKYRLLLWDYRGLYRSEVPASQDNLTIEDNCRDLDELMAAEGIEHMALAGWSVGVQVALEQYRRRPECIEALLLINGAHGKVLQRSFDNKVTSVMLPMLLMRGVAVAPLLQLAVLPWLRLLSKSPLSVRMLSLAALVEGNPASFHEALQEALKIDLSVFMTMGLNADEHDTEDLLPHIRVPTLVTSGSHDLITPPQVGRHIASMIPCSEYIEFDRGTHYTVMEQPVAVANAMSRFLDTRLKNK